MRRLGSLSGLFVFALLVGFVPTQGIPSHAASTVGKLGFWDFCVDANEVGCIASLKVENASGVMESVNSKNDAMSRQISINVSCAGDTMATASLGGECRTDVVSPIACSGQSQSNCRKESDFSTPCLYLTPTLTLAVGWYQTPGRKFQLTVRTGSFAAGFVTGNGITSYVSSAGIDGLHSLTLSGFIDDLLVADMSGYASASAGSRETLNAFLATANAASRNAASRADVYPVQKLNYRPSSDVTACKLMPIKGMWSDANGANANEVALTPGDESRNEMATLSFVARGPHYGLPDASGARGLNPARFRTFVPAEMVAAAGYSSLEEFPMSAVSVSLADGQTAQPTKTVTADGVLVDLGIAHFSAPDPIVKFYKKAIAATPLPAVAVAPKTIARGKSMSRATLLKASGILQPTGSVVTLRVVASSAKVCRVQRSSVMALRTGTCKVTVAVRSRAGTVKVKTVSFAVGK